MRHRRNEFTNETKRLAYKRASGDEGVARCESDLVEILRDIGCSRILREGDINYDHVSPDAISGDNSLENCAVLCRSCHAIKTTSDRKDIASTYRKRDRSQGIRPSPSLPGSRKDDFKIKLRGRQVVDRRTSQPWRG